MSANDGAASSSNVAAEGNFEPSTNNEDASSNNVDIINNSDQDAIIKKEPAAEGNFEPSANNEAASSSNVDIIINSDQDANNEAASAEGTYMDPQLYNAAVKGNIEPFDTMREIKSIKTPNKNTILHINIMDRSRSSMETASTQFVKAILDKCPSLLRQVNVNAETPLHIAAKYGHSDIVDILIKSSAKHEDLESGTGVIRMTNNDGDTALLVAVRHNHLDVVKILIKEDPNSTGVIRMTNNDRDTALHVAVRHNHLDVVKILTENDPNFSYSSNKRGETPLYIAAAKDSLEIVVQLLETCTLPAYEGPDQMTALHAAAKHDRWWDGQDITRKILEKRKSLIKERDQYGWTPLHYAAYHRNSKSMKALLECDASIAYIGDKHRKMTPLHIAIGQGYIPHELLSRCPDCYELVDKKRWNVLHFAMLSLDFEDLKILLKEYPLIRNLINDKDVDGNTPLHLLATFRKDLIWKIVDMNMDVKLDIDVVHNKNTRSIMMESGSDQLEQEILKLEEAAGPYEDGVVTVEKESDDQNWWRPLDKEEKREYDKTKESHLIVAALIATVTFTAAFTLPGGVIQDGDKEGTAILSKKAAFQAFVITDAIAMVLSLSAVFAHFLMSLKKIVFRTEQSRFLVACGALFTMIAMGAMVIAFVTGTYAVLTTSLWLAILTTFIGLSFFLSMFLIVIGMMKAK